MFGNIQQRDAFFGTVLPGQMWGEAARHVPDPSSVRIPLTYAGTADMASEWINSSARISIAIQWSSSFSGWLSTLST